jgi:hypothetical protein
MIKIAERVDYLSLQALLKLKAPLAGLAPYALGGPRLDIKVGGSSDMPSIDQDDYKTVVAGLTLGGGLQYPIPAIGAIFVEFDYYLDLTDAYDRELLSIRNRTFALLGGIAF